MRGKTASGGRASVTSGATPSSVGWTGRPSIKSLPRFCRKCPIQLTLLTLTLWTTASVKRYFPLRSEEQLSHTWTLLSKTTTLAVCCSLQETLSDVTDRAPTGVHLAFVGYSYTATRWPERPALVLTHINPSGLFICVFPSLCWTLARQVQSTTVRTSWCRSTTRDKETGRVFTPQWSWLVFIFQATVLSWGCWVCPIPALHLEPTAVESYKHCTRRPVSIAGAPPHWGRRSYWISSCHHWGGRGDVPTTITTERRLAEVPQQKICMTPFQ